MVVNDVRGFVFFFGNRIGLKIDMGFIRRESGRGNEISGLGIRLV